MKLHRPTAALATALVVHGLFVFAVASMAWALWSGLQTGRTRFTGASALLVDAALLLQFPLLHSWLLSAAGRRWLPRLSPFGHGRTLAPSVYVMVGSLQLLLVFWCWSPSGLVWHTPHGWTGVLQGALFACAWLFLIVALTNAGLALQTGAAGWWALLRNRPVDYGAMPTRGLFARCRQPIYLGFALVLWTAPTWSLDWLALTGVWTVYCVLGPRLKEARWEAIFGARFREYQSSVPYFFPRILR